MPFREVEVLSVNVGLDTRRAAQCQKLSGGSRTVPQIFFGRQYVGGAAEVIEADKAGLLVPLLVNLARSRPVPFPPLPEAAMV